MLQQTCPKLPRGARQQQGAQAGHLCRGLPPARTAAPATAAPAPLPGGACAAWQLPSCCPPSCRTGRGCGVLARRGCSGRCPGQCAKHMGAQPRQHSQRLTPAAACSAPGKKQDSTVCHAQRQQGPVDRRLLGGQGTLCGLPAHLALHIVQGGPVGAPWRRAPVSLRGMLTSFSYLERVLHVTDSGSGKQTTVNPSHRRLQRRLPSADPVLVQGVMACRQGDAGGPPRLVLRCLWCLQLWFYQD